VLWPPAAAIGAALCAVWPLHIAYAGFFTSETPGLAFLALSLWLAQSAARRASTEEGLFAGLAGGVAAAIRPAFALNVILAAFPLARRVWVRPGPLLALAGGAALVLGLVVAHEAAIAGSIVGVSENSALTFYLGHCDIRRVTTGTPETLTYTFQTPIATQLERGHDATFPDQQIWDQGFFYAQGLGCIARDGLAHARIVLRNVYDMGLSTVPWPPSNDEGLKEVVALTNVGYVLLLPFIVFGTVRKIRRAWPVGRGRGELMILGQLALALVTAIVYFGDPRFRVPFDVFGLALAASLIADRLPLVSLAEPAPDPGVRADDSVEQYDESVLGWAQAAREIDAHHARASESEADGGAAVGADHGPPQEPRGREARGAWPDEVLGLIGSEVHEVPPVGPEPVEAERAGHLEASFGAEVPPVGEDAPDAGIRYEDADRRTGQSGRPSEEEDTTPVEKW
jgi:hypothetical protein